MKHTVFGQNFMGLVILSVGLYLSNMAANAIRKSSPVQANTIAVLAKLAIRLLVGAMAIRQMGLANEIVNMAFGIILGAITVAVAIAFGIGGREITARKLAEWSGSMEVKHPLVKGSSRE